MRDLEQIVRSNKEVDSQFTIGAQKTRINRLETALRETVQYASDGLSPEFLAALTPDHPIANALTVLAEMTEVRARTLDPLPS